MMTEEEMREEVIVCVLVQHIFYKESRAAIIQPAKDETVCELCTNRLCIT